jgi:hypothetical protein
MNGVKILKNHQLLPAGDTVMRQIVLKIILVEVANATAT